MSIPRRTNEESKNLVEEESNKNDKFEDLGKSMSTRLLFWCSGSEILDETNSSMTQWLEQKNQKQISISENKDIIMSSYQSITHTQDIITFWHKNIAEVSNYDLPMWIYWINSIVEATLKNNNEQSLQWIDHMAFYNNLITFGGEKFLPDIAEEDENYCKEMIAFTNKILANNLEWMNRLIIAASAHTKKVLSDCEKHLVEINIIDDKYSVITHDIRKNHRKTTNMTNISKSDRNKLEIEINNVKQIISTLMQKNLDDVKKEKEIWRKMRENNKKNMEELFAKDFPSMTIDFAVNYVTEYKKQQFRAKKRKIDVL